MIANFVHAYYIPSSLLPPKTTTNPIAYLQIICVFYVSCNSLIVKVDHRIMLFAIDLKRKKKRKQNIHRHIQIV